MKDFPSLHEYLRINVNDTTTTLEKEQLKKDFKLLYYKEYNKQRKKNRTLSFRLSEKNHQRFINAKDAHHYRSLNQFLIDTINAYLDKSYVFPNKDSIQQLNIQLNKVGTNINQIVHKLHIHCLRMDSDTGGIQTDLQNMYRLMGGYKLLQAEVEQLKLRITEFMHTPQSNILGFSWEEIKDNTQKLDTLITYLQEHRNDL